MVALWLHIIDYGANHNMDRSIKTYINKNKMTFTLLKTIGKIFKQLIQNNEYITLLY